MFYVLIKSGETLENFNAPVEEKHPDADGAAITRARAIGADRIITSAGRVVVLPEVTTVSVPVAPVVPPAADPTLPPAAV